MSFARPSRSALVVWCTLGLLLCGCAGGNGGAAQAASESAKTKVTADRTIVLPNVDTSELTESELQLWSGLVTDELSPCGDPVSVAKCVTARAKCGACVTAARYLARLVTEGYDRAKISEQFESRFGRAAKHEIDLDGAPSRGAPMARVTIVAFSDFQCPHCGATHPELVRLLRELEGSVRLVYKYFPLSGHSRAGPAAAAAEAARLQGKFWEMHDLLFEHQDSLQDADLARYAREIGLDLARFQHDVGSPEVLARVEADRNEGLKLGVEATPTLFVNGRRFHESARELPTYVREELEL